MKQCQETLWFWKGRKWRKVSQNKVTEGNTHTDRKKCWSMLPVWERAEGTLIWRSKPQMRTPYGQTSPELWEERKAQRGSSVTWAQEICHLSTHQRTGDTTSWGQQDKGSVCMRLMGQLKLEPWLIIMKKKNWPELWNNTTDLYKMTKVVISFILK